MKTLKGPAIFLAQFAGDQPPFNTLSAIAQWAAGLGFKGIQIPTWDRRLFDLKAAAESRDYCSEILGVVRGQGLEITELSTHLQGQLIAVHPAYDALFENFAPAEVHGNPKSRQQWANQQLLLAAKASRNLDLLRSPDLFRCARLAPLLSLAAETPRADRGGIRRTCAEMEADSRCLR